MAARAPRLVRYVSPFGSPASMAPASAERHLAEDAALWARLAAIGGLTQQQRRIGPPRVGDDGFHRIDLPDWDEFAPIDGLANGVDAVWEVLRAACRTAEARGRDRGGQWVVIVRDGRVAVTRPAYVLADDSIRWTVQ